MNNLAIDHWLESNPEWILSADLKACLVNQNDYQVIRQKHEHGYLTREGEFFDSLRSVPTFAGIKQVIKARRLVQPVA